MAKSEMAGKRVLLVEDEVMIALMLEDILADLGCEVIGPVSRIAAAKTMIETERVDCALLDINLHGQPVYPLVDLLAERAVPFGFVTGYGSGGVDKQFRRHLVLHKPFNSDELEGMLVKMTRPSAPRRRAVQPH